MHFIITKNGDRLNPAVVKVIHRIASPGQKVRWVADCGDDGQFELHGPPQQPLTILPGSGELVHFLVDERYAYGTPDEEPVAADVRADRTEVIGWAVMPYRAMSDQQVNDVGGFDLTIDNYRIDNIGDCPLAPITVNDDFNRCETVFTVVRDGTRWRPTPGVYNTLHHGIVFDSLEDAAALALDCARARWRKEQEIAVEVAHLLVIADEAEHREAADAPDISAD